MKDSGSPVRSSSVRTSCPRASSSRTRAAEVSMNVTSCPAARNPSPVAVPTTPEPTMKILDDCMGSDFLPLHGHVPMRSFATLSKASEGPLPRGYVTRSERSTPQRAQPREESAGHDDVAGRHPFGSSTERNKEINSE